LDVLAALIFAIKIGIGRALNFFVKTAQNRPARSGDWLMLDAVAAGP
jgi:hypothetical protein